MSETPTYSEARSLSQFEQETIELCIRFALGENVTVGRDAALDALADIQRATAVRLVFGRNKGGNRPPPIYLERGQGGEG